MKIVNLKWNNILYALVVFLLIIIRLLFSKDFPVFFVTTLKIDDELMVNQMMTLSQRIVFGFILSKDIN